MPPLGGLRKLGDSNFYVETPEDLTSIHTMAVYDKLKTMHENKEIDDNCLEYLTQFKGRTALFYMLPTIHKKLQGPPGTPIVSGNGCPTENIALDNLGNILTNAILVTLDVAGLYTNIPNYEGLELARLALHA